MAYAYNGVLSSLKKEGDPDTCCTTDEPVDVMLSERAVTGQGGPGRSHPQHGGAGGTRDAVGEGRVTAKEDERVLETTVEAAEQCAGT